MFGIVLSALNVLLGFIFRSVVIKFAVFFGLFFVTTEFISVLSGLLPISSALTGSLGGIPAGVWYFLDLFNVSAGLPMLLSAWATRFIIRRIPVIG
jgi:hypothetical protein